MENRIYVNDLSGGDRVKVVVLNGAQYCSLISKGEDIGDTNLRAMRKASQGKSDAPERVVEQKAPAFTPTGESVTLAAKDARKQVLAGYTIINPAGKKIPFTKKAENEPERKYKFLLDKKTKTYYMQ